jgi:type IV pilus modification protein PilV
MIKEFFKNKKGFTLVETLVAITIFTMSILALLSVLSQSISSTNYAKRKTVATYLAQEGIEYMRNLRDTYVLYSSDASTGWTNFNNKLSATASNCQCYFDDSSVSFVDTSMPITDLNFTLCPFAVCPNLLYDSWTGKYGYTATGTTIDSGYARRITIIKPSPNETKIFSTVFWTQGSGTQSVTFSESLFNWVE